VERKDIGDIIVTFVLVAIRVDEQRGKLETSWLMFWEQRCCGRGLDGKGCRTWYDGLHS
jgi:hypothetical protein